MEGRAKKLAGNPGKSVSAPVGWAVSDMPQDYLDAMSAMQRRADAIRTLGAGELVWLVEHPPLLTAGASADPAELLAGDRLPVYEAGRGGRYTYHGPGQRVAYVMLDLKARGGDVRALVHGLEAWIIGALQAFNVVGERRGDRVGVWVRRPDIAVDREDKIAAIGLRVSRGVTTHGISLNVEPDLSHYAAIVPCGIAGHGVTSLADLGLTTTMTDVDIALKRSFEATFGAVVAQPPPSAA